MLNRPTQPTDDVSYQDRLTEPATSQGMDAPKIRGGIDRGLTEHLPMLAATVVTRHLAPGAARHGEPSTASVPAVAARVIP
jgi:hypothetical protein